MITLEKSFVSGVGGYSAAPHTFTQIKRTDKYAMYHRTRQDGRHFTYEVFKIQIKPKGTRIFQVVLEDDTEQYPSNSAFGHTAWEYRHLQWAETAYNNLIQTGSPREGFVIDPVAIDSDPEADTLLLNSTIVPITKLKHISLKLPTGEFSTKDLAEFNKTDYNNAAVFLRDSLQQGTIKFIKEERRALKGKPTKIYVKS